MCRRKRNNLRITAMVLSAVLAFNMAALASASEETAADLASQYETETETETEVKETVIMQYADDDTEGYTGYTVYEYTDGYAEDGAEEPVVETEISQTWEAEEDTVAKKTDDFIKSLAVTSNFDIYAYTFNENCHIDGNIAVKELTTNASPVTEKKYEWNNETNSLDITDVTYTPVETLKKGGYTAPGGSVDGLDPYSIIYDGNDLRYGTIDNGAIVISGNLSAQNKNGGSQLVDITDELNAATTENAKIEAIADAVVNSYGKDMTAADQEALRERVSKEADIEGNLEDIAKKAEALNSELAEKQAEGITANDVVDGAIDMLKDNALDADSIITINATVADLNDGGLTGKMEQLLSANKEVGATIILNIVAGAEDAELVITQPLNGNGAYDKATSYLIWNFGAYEGKVQYTQTTEGIIVAPKATVETVVMDGRIIAKEVIQNDGQEIHQPNVPKQELPKESESEIETESKETESKETESQETESKETESQETESQETESQETESQETESQETESQETESQETESKETESQETEPEETEPRQTETKRVSPEYETKEKETQETKPVETEPGQTETKRVSPEYEPKQTEPKETGALPKQPELQRNTEAVLKETAKTDSVATGDNSMLPLAAGMAVVSGLGLVVIGLQRKKEEE